jgi:hypothetical protein
MMSDYQPRLLTNGDRSQWQALWERSPRYLSQHWEFLEAAAAGSGTPVRVGLFTADGRLVAGVPFVARRLRLITQWRHAAPAPFAGLLHDREAVQESWWRDVLAPLAEFIEKSVPVAEIVFAPGVEDGRPLLWRRWRVQPHYNYSSPLETPGSLLQNSENAARRQGKKALETHEVRFGTGELPELFALWDETCTRQGIPPYVKKECFQYLEKYTAERPDSLQCWVATVRSKDSGSAAAGGLFVRDRSRLYYLLGASSAESGMGSGAPSLLHFAVTDRVLEETGPFIYDWVGANTPSIAQFKKKFRPNLELYLRATWRRGMVREWM